MISYVLTPSLIEIAPNRRQAVHLNTVLSCSWFHKQACEVLMLWKNHCYNYYSSFENHLKFGTHSSSPLDLIWTRCHESVAESGESLWFSQPLQSFPHVSPIQLFPLLRSFLCFPLFQFIGGLLLLLFPFAEKFPTRFTGIWRGSVAAGTTTSGGR